MKQRSHLKPILITVIIAIIVAGGAIWWLSKSSAESAQNVPTTEAPRAPQGDAASQEGVEQSTDESEEAGTITGSLTYPSEAFPPDMEVHATNIDTNQDYISTDRIEGSQYKYGTGYKLDVPAGRYYVYGLLRSQPNDRAYYNQFIKCGMAIECTDQSKIEVVVKQGQSTEDIMVGDWWNQEIL